MDRIKLSMAAFAIVATLSGCGGGAPLTPEQQQTLQKFDISQIEKFGERLHSAMNEDELLYYAPYSIDLAQENYQDAMQAAKKEEKMASYLQAKKALEDAYDTKKMVQKYLVDLADIQRRMDIQNTKEIFASRYENFKDDYNDLIVLIDKRETSQALEDKTSVMEEAKDLYGDAVVYRNINPAKIILEKMEDDDLDELAPVHFEKAQKLYESSRLRIKKEPDNKEMVQRVAQNTNEAAKYAQTLAKDVLHFRELNEDEQEAYFAKLHRRLAKLNPNEEQKAILPLPIYEKIDYLQELKMPSQYIAPQNIVPVETDEVIMEVQELPKIQKDEMAASKESLDELQETLEEKPSSDNNLSRVLTEASEDTQEKAQDELHSADEDVQDIQKEISVEVQEPLETQVVNPEETDTKEPTTSTEISAEKTVAPQETQNSEATPKEVKESTESAPQTSSN